ncbi:hypothetical protein BO71DRAFT_489576, partial [Aspergillus ellipticus CBS 707.79]
MTRDFPRSSSQSVTVRHRPSPSCFKTPARNRQPQAQAPPCRPRRLINRPADAMPQSEVLVHIAAPSTAAHDARYRAQVAAILGFQAFSRQRITLPNHADDLEKLADLRQEHDHAQPNTSPAASHLPSAASPAQQHPSHCDKDSLDTPLSVIPDSQPPPPPESYDEDDLQEIEPPQPSPITRKSPFADAEETCDSPPPPAKRCRLSSPPSGPRKSPQVSKQFPEVPIPKDREKDSHEAPNPNQDAQRIITKSPLTKINKATSPPTAEHTHHHHHHYPPPPPETSSPSPS